MKITTMLQARGSDFEQRKRLLARKEMDQAYKKNAKFVEASKNPLLAALENLLSGKAEKDLINQDIEAKKQFNPNSFSQIVDKSDVYDQVYKVAGGEVIDGEESIQMVTGSTDETLQILEKVRSTALSSISSSPQDFRIAEAASTQIQALHGESFEETNIEEVPPYAGELFDVEVPERFASDVKRDVEAPTVFGKELERELFARTFNRAKSTYSNHIAMVKNSYRSYNEPQFTMVV